MPTPPRSPARLLWIAAIHALVLSTYCIMLLDPARINELGMEDGPIEYTGAIAFLVASICFLICWLRWAQGNDLLILRTRRNVFFLIMAAAFFFAGGEEASWGQRIFGWQTPESMAAVNSQGETTIHNLAIFQEDRLLNFHMLFNIFWLGYCVMLPLAVLFRQPRELARRIGVPIPPIWAGTLLLSSYAVFKLLAVNAAQAEGVRHALNELKETNGAVGFAVLGVYFLLPLPRAKAAPDAA